MRIGVMQPYFFPYVGHYALIANVDRWVVFDTPQYTPKTWINRNRVLHPKAGVMWVTVPLRGATRSMPISSATIVDPEAALASVRGKLAHYRRVAPYYRSVVGLVDEAFAQLRGDDSLVSLNVSTLSVVCQYIDIPFGASRWSTSGIRLPDIDHPGGWAPAIASAMGATEYVNPVGGAALFRPDDFLRGGISLKLLEMPSFVYDPAPFGFERNLSILDVLMWNPPSEVRSAIGAARLLAPPWGLQESA